MIGETIVADGISRRTFLRSGVALSALAGLDTLVPRYAWARGDLAGRRPDILDGSTGPIDLTIGQVDIPIDGRLGRATKINGTLPGPLLRFRGALLNPARTSRTRPLKRRATSTLPSSEASSTTTISSGSLVCSKTDPMVWPREEAALRQGITTESFMNRRDPGGELSDCR